MHTPLKENRASARRLRAEWEKASQAISGYHIHIYYWSGNYGYGRHVAEWFCQDIADIFSEDVQEPPHFISPIGPHTQPNFSLSIKPDSFGRVVSWLQCNRRDRQLGLSILIHPETGNDVKDHLESSLWLGHPRDYNQGFFERLRQTGQTRQPKEQPPAP